MGFALENRNQITITVSIRCFSHWQKDVLKQSEMVVFLNYIPIETVDNNKFSACVGKLFGMIIKLEE